MVFKCKMCGGSLDISPEMTIGTCRYCGSVMTLPKLSSEKRANLYERANVCRRANDYDRAMALYETILSEDPTDAEAYWSLVLCKYGVEYVEDPRTRLPVITCNRTQARSVFDDVDYKQALSHAEGEAKAIYEEDAAAIDAIQKSILEIANHEEPFDIFICYKEADERGRRTPDSTIAHDVYTNLTEKGYRVFFSRITLEDKL
jgi:tetratricopeptide (TPR) repeat protein